MICPICKLENPPSSTRCDCGHTFGGTGEQTGYYLREIADGVDSIRRMILAWLVLMFVGTIVAGVLIVHENAERKEVLRDIQQQIQRSTSR
jgi:hypothetical protein